MIQNNKGSFSEDNEFEKQSKGECAVSKFDFKKKYLIIYLLLIAFDAFLMLCRWLGHFGAVDKVSQQPSRYVIMRKTT